ncbi:hypothetical protein [Brevundimonas sp. FT23028]|uniref:hypothetical protein n=1 Tax=Brevundimonas sp. FT23028 TaxID=3393748 RepID=UPI003B58ADBA
MIAATGCSERDVEPSVTAPEPAQALPAGPNCDPRDQGTPAGFCERVEEFGRFESAQAGPVIDGAPTFEVFYSPSWGTGIRIQSVALLSQTRNGFKVLWSHPVLEVSDIMPDRYPGSADVYEWRYAPDARRITVTGTRTEGRVLSMWDGRAEGERTSLPGETWCYAAAARVFEPC